MSSNINDMTQLVSLLSLKSAEAKLLHKAKLSLRETIFADTDYLKFSCKLNDCTIAKIQSLKNIIDKAALETIKEKPILGSFEQVIKYYQLTMSSKLKEHMCVFFINSKNILIDSSKECGCVNSVHIYVRNIIKTALNLEATGIILVHNHPSGSDIPSHNDISTTQELITASKPLDINVLDHIIITRSSHFSFRENGLI